MEQLAQGAEAPVEWTWDQLVREEVARTTGLAYAYAFIAERSTGSLRREANRLYNLYLLLWRQRSRWCGPAPPRDRPALARNAMLTNPPTRALLLEALPRRLCLVAAFMLREPRPGLPPVQAQARLVERNPATDPETGAWIDLRGLVPRQEEVDCRRHELIIINALQYEIKKLSDGSRAHA